MAAPVGAATFISNQGLSAGNAFASYDAHPYVSNIRTNSDHTACPAVASGYGGYTSTPFGAPHWTAYQSPLCGPGVRSWGPNPVATSLHGAVYNPNISTFDVIALGEYWWW